MATNDAPKQQRQQLSKGMEHIRYAVTIDPAFRPKQTQSPSPAPSSSTDNNSNTNNTTTADSSTSTADETTTYGVPSSIIEPVRQPASSRSHDPENNQKRSDPFQFGSRYLEEGDNIFEFNAWDHVQVDAAYKDFAEQQYAAQRAAPVADFDKKKYLAEPEKYWDLFYSNNAQNFFKDRKWLRQEFPVLEQVLRPDAGPHTVLEVGAGAGNTAFPILALNQNAQLKIHACDFSKKAVELIRGNAAYADPPVGKIQADVWDAASTTLPEGLSEGSADVVLMVFIFSALSPAQWSQCVRNVWRVLKPGGQVLLRDYGRGDLAQVRFKKGRYLEENFYIRGDGTRVYFFEEEELRDIWTRSVSAEEGKGDAEEAVGETESKMETLSLSEGREQVESSEEEKAPAKDSFNIIHIGTDRRLLVNRQRKLKMYRCWMQAIFQKPES